MSSGNVGGRVVGKAPRGGWVLATEIPARTLSRGNLLNLTTEEEKIFKMIVLKCSKSTVQILFMKI